MRGPSAFAIVAALTAPVGLYCAYVPIERMESKVGSWEYAREVLASNPGHWTLAVAIRLLVAASLVWAAYRTHLHRRWTGFMMLLVAVPLYWIADLLLWVFADL